MIKKLALLFASVLFCFILAEAVLAILGLPRFYQRHSSPPQFSFIGIEDGQPVYINAVSERIRFVYDGNPRGYFGKDNEVDHITNSAGFRGREFSPEKPKGIKRIAFIGDSFTFGEGVRFEDTYPELTASLLNQKIAPGSQKFESYNFGVGGYNSVQETAALERFVFKYNPDIVVLKYDLSEAEPALFAVSAQTGEITRVPRWYEVESGLFNPQPPQNFFYKSRLARLLWQINANRKKNALMLAYYHALYRAGSPDRIESEQALRNFIRLCRKKNIPVYVVFFPMLYQLQHYPFGYVHQRVARVAEEERAAFIDLFDPLKNMPAEKLWVHPTDHHPNDIVQRIAAEAIAAKINN